MYIESVQPTVTRLQKEFTEPMALSSTQPDGWLERYMAEGTPRLRHFQS
jgi:hypothetical protein